VNDDEREIRKQALITTASFIADERRDRELLAGGAICRSHGLAILVTHVNDGEPCSDYLHDGPTNAKDVAGVSDNDTQN
jgi:hypothetical protein